MRRQAFVFPEKEREFIKNYAPTKTDHQIAECLGVNKYKIQEERYRLGIYRKIGGKYDLKVFASAMEDYIGNGLSIVEIANKYDVKHSTVSRYISRMLFIKPNENTKTITLQSRV